MTTKREFIQPKPGQFSLDWEGGQQSLRFTLDQVDGLVEAIKSGQLKGMDAAMQLHLLTRDAMSDAHSTVLLEDEASHPDSKPFWAYALTQAEKARAAFDFIQNVPKGKQQAKIFNAERANCDDHVQFFRTLHNVGVKAALRQKTGPNPHVGRG